ncbi:hypothetical protein [Streptomyces sp. BE147]|uniref:hypothetical protein n=1 Tax=unclassified Streptomyces TaxID=2593676 RepID=UPI002E7A1C4B|nr:hypothetical protein [Streptomyces sp. BE147]MEE1737589.1 hypothetical protein [Streptomyces sp. BE147]
MWWFKARRVHTHLPAGLLLFVLLAAMVQDGPVPLPSISLGTSEGAQAMLFVPLALTAVLFNCLGSRLGPAEDSGVRPVRVYDALLALGVVALAGPIGSALAEVTGSRAARTLDRNTAFLAGLTLLCGALFGSSAVLMPAVWPLLVVMFGLRGPGDPYPWTVLLEPAHTWYATTGAVLMLAVGIGFHIFCPRRPA